MADKIEHLMLEQFRKQREHIDHVLAEVRNLKIEMQAVRMHLRGVEIDSETQRDSLARLETRVDRIERRLELSEPDPTSPTGFSEGVPPYRARPSERR